MKILTEKDFYDQVDSYRKDNIDYWLRDRAKLRWSYYSAVVDLLKTIKFKNSLEAGTMGIKVIDTSNEIDFNTESKYQYFNPTYKHNLKEFPWPIKNKQYDVFIATRVFQHLMPFQKSCFKEAARIAKNIILVIPVLDVANEKKKIFSNYEVFTEWNDGTPPTQVKSVKYDHSKIILWNESNLSRGGVFDS